MLRIILPLLAINLALQLSPVSGDALSSWDALVNGKGIFDDVANLREFKSTTSDNDASQLDQFTDLLEDGDLLENVYSNYRKLFKKTEDTKAARLNVFKTKLISAAAHNLEAKEGKHSWVKGVNQFTDMTESELNRRYSVDFSGFVNELKSSNPGNLSSLLTKPNPYPDAVNWTEKGIVTSVKQQGECNSCVLFAATALLESLTAMAHATEPVDLSPQELLDCAVPYFQCSDPGTNPTDSVKYLHHFGVTSWEEYPYNDPPVKEVCSAEGKPRAAKLKAGKFITEPSEADMKYAAGVTGPMMTGIKSEFTYDGGILENSGCGGDPNHAVLLVGYGSEGGKDYWLVKNSWGQFWGESGYMRIQRNDNRACGIGCFIYGGKAE